MTNTNSPRKRLRTWRDDVAGEFHRFRSKMTRENVISNLKTLAWVVPLTLLIWIWAEREQVQPAKDVAVPFELTSVDANRVITLKGQDNNLVLELSGPQARLQELRSKLSGGQMPKGLRLDVPTSYAINQDHKLRTSELVNNQQIFADYGVTVMGVQPMWVDVSVDELVEREARVVVPPSVNNVRATFGPPAVKVRGPKKVLDRAAQPQRGQLVVYAVADTWPMAPGPHEVPDVVLMAPEDLKDDRVRVNEAKVKVRATLEVSQSDKTYRFDSLTVTSDAPVGTYDKYDIVIPRPAVQNITVLGPPDLIDAIQKGDYEPRPKARLVITNADLAIVGELRSKVVEYDLPKGVDVSPEDKKKTVEFKVVDRATTPAP